jgi:hypothetical protein
VHLFGFTIGIYCDARTNILRFTDQYIAMHGPMKVKFALRVMLFSMLNVLYFYNATSQSLLLLWLLIILHKVSGIFNALNLRFDVLFFTFFIRVLVLKAHSSVQRSFKLMLSPAAHCTVLSIWASQTGCESQVCGEKKTERHVRQVRCLDWKTSLWRNAENIR